MQNAPSTAYRLCQIKLDGMMLTNRLVLYSAKMARGHRASGAVARIAGAA